MATGLAAVNAPEGCRRLVPERPRSGSAALCSCSKDTWSELQNRLRSPVLWTLSAAKGGIVSTRFGTDRQDPSVAALPRDDSPPGLVPWGAQAVGEPDSSEQVLEPRILAHRVVTGVNGQKYQAAGVGVHRPFQQGEGGVFVA